MEPKASDQEEPEVRRGFLGTVVREVMDVRPAAVVASLVQFGLVYLISRGLIIGCGLAPAGLRPYCNPDQLSQATNAFPAIVFWMICIVLAVFTVFVAIPVIWFAIPFGLAVGALYLAAFLPQPFAAIAGVAGVLGVFYFWAMAVHGVIDGR